MIADALQKPPAEWDGFEHAVREACKPAKAGEKQFFRKGRRHVSGELDAGRSACPLVPGGRGRVQAVEFEKGTRHVVDRDFFVQSIRFRTV